MLQDIVGVESDGWIGPQTLGAVSMLGHKAVLVMLIGARQFHIALRVQQDATQAEYVKGWRRRNLAFLPVERHA
jgi:lysozyme family protein